MRAWIMVSCKIGPQFDVRAASNQIKQKFKHEEIGNVLDVFGPYDVVVEVQASSVDIIYEKYIRNINSLPAVSGLSTYLSVGSAKTKEIELKIPTAYILIDALPEYLDYVQDKVFELDEVQKCDIVLGPYDVIAEVVAEDLKQLINLVAQISKINGVAKTLTMIVVH
jgi:DNA-binding Lrp family transcriptional regulator